MSDDKKIGLSVRELAERLGCSFEGDGDVRISNVASLEKAGPGDLAFLSHAKHRHLLDATKASAAIIPDDEPAPRIPVIRSGHPHHVFINAVLIFRPSMRPGPGIHPLASIAPSARIGEGVSIGALAVIGENADIGAGCVIHPLAAVYRGAKIGENTTLHAHVSIREDVVIGRNVIIHNGVVIGADGFGYLQTPDGHHLKIPQIGRVVIEDDVEIGANAVIDRAALDETIVRQGAKIDDLVMIAHNVEIGENAIIIGQAGVAGSSRIGRGAILSGQVGVADHVTVGAGAIAAAKSGITGNVPAGAVVSGSPHLDIRDWRKVWATAPKLYDLIKEVKRLQARVEELEKKRNG